VKLHWPGHRTW